MVPTDLIVNTSVQHAITHLSMYFHQTWYMLSPYESLEPIDFQGQRSRGQIFPHNILVNTLELTSFNGF